MKYFKENIQIGYKTKALVATVAILALLTGLAGCGNAPQTDPSSGRAGTAGDESRADQNTEADVRTVTIAYSAASRPMSFLNDAGEADGYEVQVLREIGDLLPQYSFEFVAIPDDSDLLIGIETGKYDLGVKGAWITEERLQKFVFPQNPVGASSIGLLYRAEDGYTNLEAFGNAAGKLVPIAPQNAQYNVILDFNEQHPEAAIELVASETFSVGDAYRWVIEGRFDGYFETKTAYLRNIKEEDSPYHEYDGQLVYFTHRALPTWPLFYRENQQIADDYDQAFLQLLDNGRIDAIMHEYLDENTFQYITGDDYGVCPEICVNIE